MSPPSRIASTAASALRSGTPGLRPLPSKPIAAQLLCRHSSSKSRIARENERSNRTLESRMSRMASMGELEKQANTEYFNQGGGPLFPGTFIALPLSLAPRSPAAFAQYQLQRLKHWGIEALSVLNFKLQSMSSWTSRPRWKARRGRIAPTAKAMYQEMMEAFAAGDKQTVKRLCWGDFGNKLIAAIDRRNPREQIRFEITKHNSPLFYPRLKSHQVHQANPFDKACVTEQAVVALSSTQKVSRHDAATGETVPGSVKVQDKVEYVVLSRLLNQSTWEAGPWRIWGTKTATTLEGYYREKEAIEKEQAKRAGWESTPK